MDINEFYMFLKKFGILKQEIDRLTQNKDLFEIHNNVFLTNESFKNLEVYKDMLLFIKLNELLPSKFLLNWISNNSQNLEVKSEKKAIEFTYSKNLNVQDLSLPSTDQEYFIVKFKDDVLGYVSFDGTKFKNEMNIGKYLKEN